MRFVKFGEIGKKRSVSLFTNFHPFPPVRLADVSLVGIGEKELSHGPTRIDYTEGPDPKLAEWPVTPRPVKKDLTHNNRQSASKGRGS